MARLRELFFDTGDEHPRLVDTKDRRKCGDKPRVDNHMLAANFIQRNQIGFGHKENSETCEASRSSNLITPFRPVYPPLERSPVRFGPNTDIWHPLKESTKRRHDLRVTHELLQPFQVMLRVNGEVFLRGVGMQMLAVRNGAHRGCQGGRLVEWGMVSQ